MNNSMTGTKLYIKKSRTYIFLIVYGVLAVAGGVLIALDISGGKGPSGGSGFMTVFGAGMFFMTLNKSRRPQVSVLQDYIELNQGRSKQLVRFRNIVSVSRPAKDRIVIVLREEGVRKEVTVWTRELEESDAGRLSEFLSTKGYKSGSKD